MTGNVVRPKAFTRTADEGEATETISVENSNRAAVTAGATADMQNFKDLAWEKDVQIIHLRAIEAELQAELSEKEHVLEQTRFAHAAEHAEVERLADLLETHESRVEEIKTEFNRKLARFADQSWEKDLKIKALVSELDEASTRLRNLETARLELEARFQLGSFKVTEAEREVERIQEQMAQLRETAKQQTEAQKAELAKSKSAQEAFFAAHQQDKQKLSIELSNAQHMIRGLETERHRLIVETEKQNVATAALRDRVNKLQGEIDLRNSSRTYELSRTADEYSHSMSKLAEQHNHDIEKLQSFNANEKQNLLEQAARQLKQAQEEAANRIATLKRDYDAIVSSSRDSDTKFTTQITHLREQSLAQIQTIEELGLKSHDLQRTLLAEKSAHASASEELTRKRQMISAMTEEIESLRSAKTELNSQRLEDRVQRAADDQEIARLTKLAVDAQAAIEDLEQQLAASVEQLKARAKAVAELEAARDAAVRDAEAAGRRLHEQNVVLEALADRETLVREELEKERGLKNFEITAARRAADESAAAITDLKMRLRSNEFDLKSTRDKLSARAGEVEKERAELLARLEAETQKHAHREDKLRAELESAEAAFKQTRENFAAEQNKAAQQFEAEKLSIRADFSAVTRQFEAEKIAMKSDFSAVVRQHEAEKVSMRSDFSAATQQHETEKLAMKSDFSEALVQLESRLSASVRENADVVREFTLAKTSQEIRTHESNERIAELERRIIALGNQTVELKARGNDREAELQLEITQARVALRNSKAEIEKLKADADHSMAALGESYNQQLERAEREIAELKKKMNAKAVQDDSQKRATEVRQIEVAQREEQLRQYANFVTDQKADLVRQTRKLADEIQMTGRMHPLRDYLELTEFELSKTEVQLKVTPTLSMDRARLEMCVVQLTDQRKFLQSVIDAAAKRLDEQAAGILALVNSPSLGATPPIPPKMKVPGETAGAVATATVIVPIKRSHGPTANT